MSQTYTIGARDSGALQERLHGRKRKIYRKRKKGRPRKGALERIKELKHGR